MAGRPRRRFPRVVIEREAETEESSSSEEEEEEVEEPEQADATKEEEEEEEEEVVDNGAENGADSKKRKRKPISISLKQVCKGEMQQLRDKLALAERTAKTEAQLKEKLKLRLKVLEEGLKASSNLEGQRSSNGTQRLQSTGGVEYSSKFSTNGLGFRRASVSELRECVSSNASSVLKEVVSLDTNISSTKGSEEQNDTKKVYRVSRNTEVHNTGKENSERKPPEIIEASTDDSVSGILYDILQKEVITLRKACCEKDQCLKDKDDAIKIKPTYVIPNQVDCAIIKLHSRRVTSLEFHPTKNNVLISGDKKGQVGIWDYEKVYEKTVYDTIHTCILNSIKFHPLNDASIYTCGSDGTISCADIETGVPVLLMDLNPDGWNGPATWRMMYGMDINTEKNLVLVADNFGLLYKVDMRSNKKTGEPILIHKKGSKVVGLHCNPVHPDLLISCGNDHFARIWDIRKLESGACLEELAHSRVVNSAYFSPRTGSKILTTCQDNRIRVWDSIFGDLNFPSREIVHSHDFNRHLTCFRAEWDPKDPSECLAVIGRYISDNFNDVALHPIDFIDTSTGQLVAEVMDPNITTISPVHKLHPRSDVLASGSSRSLFIWRPKEQLDSEEITDERNSKVSIYTVQDAKKGKGKFEDDNDDGDDDIFSVKKFKSRASSSKRVVTCPTDSKSKKSRKKK